MTRLNDLQKTIAQDYLDAVQNQDGRSRKDMLRPIASKYGLTLHTLEGVLLMAVREGLEQSGGSDVRAGRKWGPRNVNQALADLERRVADLERKFGHVLDGITNVLDESEILGSHIAQLRKMGRWFKTTQAIEVDERRRLLEGRP